MKVHTLWKVSVFAVFLFRNLSCSNWIWRNTDQKNFEHLSKVNIDFRYRPPGQYKNHIKANNKNTDQNDVNDADLALF